MTTLPTLKTDFLIVGAGVVGLAMARTILRHQPSAQIIILEKESDIAFHASGRNSGVLHAGFYYSQNSLKAKFTLEGNRALQALCAEAQIPVNLNKKLVVAQNESEIEGVRELYRRGVANGVPVQVVSAKEAEEIESNVQTTEIALYSPLTATVNPKKVCLYLKNTLERQGVRFFFGEGYGRKIDPQAMVTTTGRRIEFGTLVNCAGLHADRVAHEFGAGLKYTIIPFKGLYLKYTKNDHPVRTNIYPVPNLKNPFLGVHFTITVDGHIKIGPTAIPAFWRENYSGFSRFQFGEMVSILSDEAKLFMKNSFGFRDLAFEEMKKYSKAYMVGLAQKLVKNIDASGFTTWGPPGIRAQLLNKETGLLVQDFVVEGARSSVHVLNAVSPAFTSSLPFAEWVYEQHIGPLKPRMATSPVLESPV